jgi:hypothetical protein
MDSFTAHQASCSDAAREELELKVDDLRSALHEREAENNAAREEFDIKVEELQFALNDIKEELAFLVDTIAYNDQKEARLIEAQSHLEHLLEQATHILQHKEDALVSARDRITELAENLAASREQLRQRDAMVLDSSYKYDLSRVLELSRLVLQHFNDKPSEVDVNRIYFRVEHIYEECKRIDSREECKRIDSREHWQMARMLLTICSSEKGWFSNKQKRNMNAWCTHAQRG